MSNPTSPKWSDIERRLRAEVSGETPSPDLVDRSLRAVRASSDIAPQRTGRMWWYLAPAALAAALIVTVLLPAKQLERPLTLASAPDVLSISPQLVLAAADKPLRTEAARIRQDLTTASQFVASYLPEL